MDDTILRAAGQAQAASAAREAWRAHAALELYVGLLGSLVGWTTKPPIDHAYLEAWAKDAIAAADELMRQLERRP